MAAYTGIHAHAVDNLLCIQTDRLSVCVQLVEIRNTNSKIAVGKELDRLCLCRVSDKSLYILRLLTRPFLLGPCTFKQEIGKHLCLLLLIVLCTDNDA